MKSKRKTKLKRIQQMKIHSNDKEYILNHIRFNIDLLEYIDEELLEDKEFMIQILKINGLALKYASDKLKDDKLVVLLAIRESSGFAFKYASKRLRADRELVYEAIKKWKGPLEYVLDEELKKEIHKNIIEYYKKHPK